MNILELTSCYPVEHSPSDGIFVRSQSEALMRAGASVTVFAPRPWVPPGFAALSAKWRTYRDTPEFYTLNGIPVHRPRHFAPPRSDLWMPVHWQYMRLAEREMKIRPDVIHAHFAYPGGVAGVLLARRWGVPVVVTLHGDDVHTHPMRYPRLRRALMYGSTHADEVIGVSEALADCARGLTGRRPRVAPIGINMNVFAGAGNRAEARRALGLEPGKKILLHLGRLVPEKGISDLLLTLDALRDPACLSLFVGAGPMAGLVGSRSDCRVLGVQPNERVPLFLQAADLIVLPSHSEGMPTVLIEAGAAGLPVVATGVGGIPELLGGGRGWLVPPRDVKALAVAIRSVLNNPAEAAARSERLKAYVLERYDVNRNARALLTLFETLVSRKGKTACT